MMNFRITHLGFEGTPKAEAWKSGRVEGTVHLHIPVLEARPQSKGIYINSKG